jgi:cell division protein FtsB
MPRHKQHSAFRRFFGSRLFLLTAFFAAVFLAFGYARGYYQDYKIKEEIRLLQEEVKSLERKKLESMEILEYVTSPEFVEEKARTELNLKKPDEMVLVIQQREEKEDEQKKELDNRQTGQPAPNHLKWWYYFTQHQEKSFDGVGR